MTIVTYGGELYHYGRKGMKWGEHVYSRNDIKELKRFMRSKDAKGYAKRYNTNNSIKMKWKMPDINKAYSITD